MPDMILKTMIFPAANDLPAAKKLFTELLGVEPYIEQPYYVGFRVGEQEIGLDPNGHRDGATPYFRVDDIASSLNALKASGAEVLQDVKNVGGGKLIAVVKDPNGNIIGLTNM